MTSELTADAIVQQGRPWRGQSPMERREARRERLLAAALELFGTTGYAATSLTALCAEGGVSPRHFYEIHPGREQLLAELYGQITSDVVRRIRAAQATAPVTVAGQVEQSLQAIVDALASDPRRARVALLEVVGVSTALDDRRREAVHAFAAALAAGHARLAEAGVVRQRDFSGVALGLVGAVGELLTDWLLREPRPDATTVLPALREILTPVFEA